MGTISINEATINAVYNAPQASQGEDIDEILDKLSELLTKVDDLLKSSDENVKKAIKAKTMAKLGEIAEKTAIAALIKLLFR